LGVAPSIAEPVALARFEQVVDLWRHGIARRRIAAMLGLNRNTVARWLAAGRFPERAARRRRRHRLDDYADYIVERFDAGLENGAALARELRTRGYTGNDAMVRRYLAELRRVRLRPMTDATKTPTTSTGAARAAGVDEGSAMNGRSQRPARLTSPAPSPRETAWLLRKSDSAPDALRPEERDYVDALCTACPALHRVRSLAKEFAELLRQRDSTALEPWLAAAEKSELRSFAAGLRRDHG
jgi:transposase